MRRPDLLVRRFLFTAAAVEPLLSMLPLPRLIVALFFRATGGTGRRRRRAFSGASTRRQPRPLLPLQFVQQHLVVAGATATNGASYDAAAAAAAAVAPQRHFPGFAEQLYLFGAVHVDAKRPRQHPVAAVRMAPPYARYASQRIHDPPRPVFPTVQSMALLMMAPLLLLMLLLLLLLIMLLVVVASVVTVPVFVATAKPSEYGHWWLTGSRICSNRFVPIRLCVRPNTKNGS